MEYFWAVFLGMVQGLTEFLPVSSSGHLVLIQRLIPSFSQPGVLFDVILHFGTLFAVFFYFRKKIFSLTSKYLFLLIVGTIPAVFIGLFFKDFLENTFSIGGIFLGLQFLVTSIFCFLTDRKNKTQKEISPTDSFLIGIFQAFAILPAVSRSASTIFVGVQRGVDRKKAAEFSFLLSIPAILGANLLEIISYKDHIFPIPAPYFFGLLAAFVTGILTIGVTINLLSQKRFKVFAVYALFLALVSLFV